MSDSLSTVSRRLVAAYYDAFNQGDDPALLALLSDDVVHEVNQGPIEAGRNAFAGFLQRARACYREQVRVAVILVSDDGMRAAAEYEVTGTYLRSEAGFPEARGQTYRLAGGAFFEIRGGRIARVTNCYNVAEWLRQVGS